MEKIISWQSSGLNQDRKSSGLGVEGLVEQSDGSSMPGVAVFKEDGRVISESASTGQFRVTAPPPSSVEAGENKTSSTTLDFVYDINLDGINVVRNDISTSTDIGKVIYGEINGTVTDFNGKPVEGIAISGSGASSTSDSNGRYEFNAPGGSNVTLSAIGTSFDVSVTGGSSTTQNIQHSGIKVDVRLPTGDTVNGAKVVSDVTTDSGKTNARGVEQLVRADINSSGTVSIFDGAIEKSITTSGQGQNLVVKLTLGVGAKGKTIDAKAGRPPVNVDVSLISDDEYTAETKSNGTFAVGSVSAGSITLEIGSSDRRYKTKTITANLDDGEVITEDVELERELSAGTVT